MALDIVILAAGKGSRMVSNRAKVLHTLAGKPLLGHVVDVARTLSPESIHIVIGHGSDQIMATFADQDDLKWVFQVEQLGTGHAVIQALPHLNPRNELLVLYGDVPLIAAETLANLLQLDTPLKLLTAIVDDPTGYGRIIRKAGNIVSIVEQKDATDKELAVNEINTGILAAPVAWLQNILPKLSANNVQKEYYLTDIVGLASAEYTGISSSQPTQYYETIGVNNRRQMAQLERTYQTQIALSLLNDGVALLDPARIDVRGRLSCGKDVVIEANVLFEGDVSLGDNVLIEANCIIRDSHIGSGSKILSFSLVEGAQIAEQVSVGPYARLRPGTVLEASAKVGNFVELKKAHLGVAAKVNHLSYVGDAEVGAGANIGAGTITCNYDGVNKHQTIIGKNAFIGSNTALVAPVTIGEDVTVAAGSTITQDIADKQLGVARSRQKNIDNWTRPEKNPR